MTFWTTTKTAMALISIGILTTPMLRRLGYLPDADRHDPLASAPEDTERHDAGTTIAPPDLSLPPSENEFPPRH